MSFFSQSRPSDRITILALENSRKRQGFRDLFEQNGGHEFEPKHDPTAAARKREVAATAERHRGEDGAGGSAVGFGGGNGVPADRVRVIQRRQQHFALVRAGGESGQQAAEDVETQVQQGRLAENRLGISSSTRQLCERVVSQFYINLPFIFFFSLDLSTGAGDPETKARIGLPLRCPVCLSG